MATKKTVTIHKRGKKPVSFARGGLHSTTNTPADEPIPAAKIQKALAGDYGEKGRKQAVMAEGLLKKGRKTAAQRRKKKAMAT